MKGWFLRQPAGSRHLTGYHTGPRVADRVPAAMGCALSGNELRWGDSTQFLTPSSSVVRLVHQCFGFFQATLQIGGSFDGE